MMETSAGRYVRPLWGWKLQQELEICLLCVLVVVASYQSSFHQLNWEKTVVSLETWKCSAFWK